MISCRGQSVHQRRWRPWEGRRDWVRSSCMPLRSLMLVVLLTHCVIAQTGTVPADRPRSCPPHLWHLLAFRFTQRVIERHRLRTFAPACTVAVAIPVASRHANAPAHLFNQGGAGDRLVIGFLLRGQKSLSCGLDYFAARASLIAATTAGASGLSPGSKRFRILPSRPMRNLPKFHFTSPGNGDAGPLST